MATQTVTTSGAGTFTVPGGVTSLTIEAWGAGAGGCGAGSGAAPGGGGGGYSFAVIAVTAGQTVFYNVGAGGPGAHTTGTAGGDSWVNPSANSEPLSNGVVGGGGTESGAGAGNNSGGAGSIGTVNFSGGTGPIFGGGGGGAGSAGNGSDGTEAVGNTAPGGAGGSPDGGAGGTGLVAGPAGNGTQPGGGGGGAQNSGNGGNGGDGQVRFTWTARFDVGTPTNLTNVPAKAFTRKHYEDLLEEIRDEALAANQLLDGLSDKERADLDFDVARAEFEELENSLGPTNYAKAMDAKEKLDRARKARDHHYFMEIVNKEIAKYNESKKK